MHAPNKRTHPKRIINERHCNWGLSLPNQRGDEAQHLETPELGMFSHSSRRTQSDDSQNKRSHEKGIGEEVHKVPKRKRAPGCEAEQLVDLSRGERKTRSLWLWDNRSTLKLSEI